MEANETYSETGERSHKERKISTASQSSRELTPDPDGGKIQPVQTDASEITYPSTAKTALIMGCLYISLFLVALDRTILATAVPRITDRFHSIDDIGWYASSYMLTACGFILLYGRIYTFYSTKWVFLSGIFLFEVGSALSGAAPSSTALIVGRAIAGFGSSGIFTGAITIMIKYVPAPRHK
jgi:MFS family permease